MKLPIGSTAMLQRYIPPDVDGWLAGQEPPAADVTVEIIAHGRDHMGIWTAVKFSDGRIERVHRDMPKAL